MIRRRGSGQKGTFADAHLKVARAYPALRPRTAIIVVGLLAAAAVGSWAAYDLTLGDRQLATKGELSSQHAGLDRECASCHVEDGDVQPLTAGCVGCHDPESLQSDDQSSVGGFTRFSMEAHARRVQRPFPVPLGDASVVGAEPACSSCHVEHLGRDADIVAVADAECTSCHEDFAFAAGDHPEFAAVSTPTESPGLLFSHTSHVPRIAERDEVVAVDATCAACHEPTPDGSRHLAIDFELHCASCHLQSGVTTDWLDVAEGSGDVGVETLATIRASGEPGSLWAASMSESQFLERRGRARKIRIEHRDPWILHNLSRLAELSGQSRSLQGLIEARPDLERASAPLAVELYAEALAELERRREALSGHPDSRVQAELAALDELIARASRTPVSQLSAEDVSAFVSLGAGAVSSDVDAEVLRDLEQGLVSPCDVCHLVERSAIARVESEQRAFFAAGFNHAKHALGTSCLDCHQRIDLEGVLDAQAADSDSTTARAEGSESEDGTESSVLNLPALANCTECHNRAASDAGCALCHTYHSGSHEQASIVGRGARLASRGMP